MTATATEPPLEASHVENNGPFHRILIERGAFLCFPPAMFNNTASEARDHCANERTFLSWLRLSIVLSIVGVAVIVNFSLNPSSAGGGSSVAKAYHLPIGILFIIASLSALLVGLLNYFKTIRGYSERRAVVQVGFKTQSVAIVLGGFIIAVAILFISTKAAPMGH